MFEIISNHSLIYLNLTTEPNLPAEAFDIFMINGESNQLLLHSIYTKVVFDYCKDFRIKSLKLPLLCVTIPEHHNLQLDVILIRDEI